MATNDSKQSNIETTLAANHRYFVRQTISTLCGLAIVSFVYVFLVSICQPNLARASLSSAYEGTVSFVIFISLFYLALVIMQLAKLITLHGKITAVEKANVANHIANGK